ncbi:MAG: LLM class F420-dependent oxidoreductase [Candidatus Thorarchaeota archaeon]|nr:MAG: LLM class F420-dependent oxidoreductase [Candidatus Thorarchaeota archaeon]
MSLKFGIQIGNYFGFDYETIMKLALTAEETGYDSLWISDHFFIDKNPETTSCLEAWTVLSALASITKKLRLGTLVTCNGFRHPSVLAKIAATVDVISNGRLEFGIGAGWKKNEHVNYGIPFPSLKERMDRLEESVQIIKKLWTEPAASFDGTYYQLNDAFFAPKPIQQIPPVFIAGRGEKRTLRIVAKHGDYCNFLYSVEPEEAARLLGILKEHCKAVDRDYDEVGKSYFAYVIMGETEDDLHRLLEQMAEKREISIDELNSNFPANVFLGTPEVVESKFEEMIGLGFDYFQIQFPYRDDLEQCKLFARVLLPKLR